MTRSQRNVVIAMVAAVALASVAGAALLAQSPPASGDRFITIGAGAQRQRCKVLQSWPVPSGGTAYHVKGVETGEIFTVVREGGDEASKQEVFVRIFRWKNGVPPDGTPVAPPINGAASPGPIYPAAAATPPVAQPPSPPVIQPVAAAAPMAVPAVLPPLPATTPPIVAPYEMQTPVTLPPAAPRALPPVVAPMPAVQTTPFQPAVPAPEYSPSPIVPQKTVALPRNQLPVVQKGIDIAIDAHAQAPWAKSDSNPHLPGKIAMETRKAEHYQEESEPSLRALNPQTINPARMTTTQAMPPLPPVAGVPRGSLTLPTTIAVEPAAGTIYNVPSPAVNAMPAGYPAPVAPPAVPMQPEVTTAAPPAAPLPPTVPAPATAETAMPPQTIVAPAYPKSAPIMVQEQPSPSGEKIVVMDSNTGSFAAQHIPTSQPAPNVPLMFSPEPQTRPMAVRPMPAGFNRTITAIVPKQAPAAAAMPIENFVPAQSTIIEAAPVVLRKPNPNGFDRTMTSIGMAPTVASQPNRSAVQTGNTPASVIRPTPTPIPMPMPMPNRNAVGEPIVEVSDPNEMPKNPVVMRKTGPAFDRTVTSIGLRSTPTSPGAFPLAQGSVPPMPPAPRAIAPSMSPAPQSQIVQVQDASTAPKRMPSVNDRPPVIAPPPMTMPQPMPTQMAAQLPTPMSTPNPVVEGPRPAPQKTAIVDWVKGRLTPTSSASVKETHMSTPSVATPASSSVEFDPRFNAPIIPMRPKMTPMAEMSQGTPKKHNLENAPVVTPAPQPMPSPSPTAMTEPFFPQPDQRAAIPPMPNMMTRPTETPLPAPVQPASATQPSAIVISPGTNPAALPAETSTTNPKPKFNGPIIINGPCDSCDTATCAPAPLTPSMIAPPLAMQSSNLRDRFKTMTTPKMQPNIVQSSPETIVVISEETVLLPQKSNVAKIAEADQASERTITVGVNGKKMACKIVQTWSPRPGSQAILVKAVETGELITVVRETSNAGKSSVQPARVFPWANAMISPAGAPVPPAIVAVEAAPELIKVEPTVVAAEPTIVPAGTAAMPIPTLEAKQPSPIPESVLQAQIPAPARRVASDGLLKQTTVTVPSNPAMDRPAMVSAGSKTDQRALSHSMEMLKDSPHPSQREQAAMELSKYDGRVHPHVVEFIVHTAVNDRAPTVRAAAINALVTMHAPGHAVASTLDTLRNDSDIRVRHAVAQATEAFGQRK